MTAQEEADYKQAKKDKIRAYNYEPAMNAMITIHNATANMDYPIAHDQDYLHRFGDYLSTAKRLGDTTLVSRGGVFPISVAEKVYNDVLRVNYLIYKELYTKQNAVDAIVRSNYASDQAFKDAVDAISWSLDTKQVFNFAD